MPDARRLARVVLGLIQARAVEFERLLGVVLDRAGRPTLGGLVDQAGDDGQDVFRPETELLPRHRTTLLAEDGKLGERLARGLGVASATWRVHAVIAALFERHGLSDERAEVLQPRALFRRNRHGVVRSGLADRLGDLRQAVGQRDLQIRLHAEGVAVQVFVIVSAQIDSSPPEILPTGGEAPNRTANSNTTTVKWSQWVGISTVSVYPYGTTTPSSTWFRPHQNCKMQYLGQPFCPVCSQTIIEKIHTLTNPIDAYSPSNASTVNLTTGSQWFKTTLRKPNPYTLKRKWELNTANISNNTDSILLNSGSLLPGANSLKVTVIDTTSLTKDINHPTLHSYSVIWNINYSPTGLVEVSPQMEYSIYPNPASNLINLKYNLLEASDIVISITDAGGKKLISKNLGKQSPGEYKNEIDINELSSRNYFLNIQINNKPNNNQFVVYK